MLDSLSNNDGLDGLYCKGCYNVKFGPQVRSSDVEHKINDTSSIKSEDPKKNCPRCSGAVFSAESIPCKDRKYHKKCASCASCEKPLTYNTVFNGTLQLTLRAPILTFKFQSLLFHCTILCEKMYSRFVKKPRHFTKFF